MPAVARGRERRADKYRRAKEQALVQFRNQHLEESLLFAQGCSTFARWYHFGIWYDDELEELLSSIGLSMFPDLTSDPPSSGRDDRPILYVATALDGIGGHGEVLRLWLKLLAERPGARQYLLTTVRAAPAFLAKVDGQGCTPLGITGDRLTDRVRSFVRQCLEIRPGVIFLFADPDDVVAITAVSVLKACLGARVVLFDHAETVFWLGKSVTDVLVEYMPAQAYVSREFRKYPGYVTVIPLTTDLADRSKFERGRAQPDVSTLSLSIGSPWKIVPDGFWNYFETVRKILEHNPTHTHVLLTLPDARVTEALRNWPQRVLDRLVVKYHESDLAPYYRRADFLIETFPMTGGQVRIEAMAFGLPIIVIQNSRYSHVLAHSGIDALVGSYPFIAQSNEDVIRCAGALVRSRDLRQRHGNFLRALFRRELSPAVIRSKLESVLGDGCPPDWLDSFAEMAGKVHVDAGYLWSIDLTREWVPSPQWFVARSLFRSGQPRFRLLLHCLANAMIEDWFWYAKRVARRLGGRVMRERIPTNA